MNDDANQSGGLMQAYTAVREGKILEGEFWREQWVNAPEDERQQRYRAAKMNIHQADVSTEEMMRDQQIVAQYEEKYPWYSKERLSETYMNMTLQGVEGLARGVWELGRTTRDVANVFLPEDMELEDYGPAPDFLPDDSWDDGIVSAVTQFLPAFLGAQKFVSGIGLFPALAQGGARAKFLANMGEGAIAGAAVDFSLFDPAEANLANVMQELGIKNEFTEFMSSSEEDPDITDRFKAALTGALAGATVDLGLYAAKGALQLGKAGGVTLAGLIGTAATQLKRLRGLQDEVINSGKSVKNQEDAEHINSLSTVLNEIEPNAQALDDTQRQVETSVRQQVADDLEGTVAKAEERVGRTVNTDDIAEIFPEYGGSLENRINHRASVHEPASYVSKKLYDKLLKDPVPEGHEDVVLFTAGGAGAGKSVGVKNLQEAGSLARPNIIYDTNMNSTGSAIKKIDQAIEAGKPVKILYTYRDPVEAMVKGTLKRAQKKLDSGEMYGRVVGLDTHIDTHNGSLKTIKELAEHYQGNENVEIVGLINKAGQEPQVVPIDQLPEPPADDELMQLLLDALEEEFQNGRVPEDVYRRTKNSGR